jgi:hypothetical protein
MSRRSRLASALAVSVAAAAVALPAAIGSAHSHGHGHHGHHGHHGGHKARIHHVLLISVDGLHQSDLRWYVRHNRHSALAALVRNGAEYSRAATPIPSDSFPGMIGQITGGDPRVTGVYYDAEYNHDLLPPGTTTCPPGAPTGTPVTYEESIDKNPSSLDAGQGLSGLPGSILSLTGDPTSLIDPSKLPVDPSTCHAVYPNQYLKVNTVFNVAHDQGLRTAWSDKHPAYQILDGPSGNGINDLFTPEINSDAIGYPAGNDWTTDNAATMQYDSYKVKAVLNEIDGLDHSGTQNVGVPAIFGMNFQTVSTAEKLPTSDGLTGGYLPGTHTPGPLLTRALGYINDQLGSMANELRARGLLDSTAIVISAKHGQSPQNPNDLTRIDDGKIIDGINAAWKQQHPGAGDLVAAATNDDAMQMWLSDRSQGAADFVASYLLTHTATGNTMDGNSRTLQQSGLSQVYAGAAAARYFGVPVSDPRHPDVWGVVQHGVVYTGGTKKIAEHGGSNSEDRHVPIVVFAPGAVRPGVRHDAVETTSIAPTILTLLGLDPRALQAVRAEGTRTLPGIH